jgi:iron complex outermembrane receptor protein
MGAYAQGTYALTDQLKLTAGVRYTYDRTNGTSISRTFTFNGALDADGYRAIGTTSCARGYSAANDCRLQSKTSTKKPTWTLNLAYNPVEDVMLYATYSRGYRQGAAAPFAAPEAQTFGPETVDVYEVGAKTSFRGKVSGRFNVAGFYSNLFNPQIQYGLQNASGGSGGTSIFSDGGKARIYGAELESSLQFLDFFRLDASGTYLNTKLLKGPNAGPFPAYPTVIPSTIVGDPLSFSPEWAANVSGTIMIPTPESVGKLEVGATYRYQASFQTAASTVSRGQLASSIKQVDLNLDWRDVGGRPVDFSLFATNVTKQKVATLITPLYATFGFDTRYLGEPRIYGAKLRVRFGAGN